jgi:hypothetical protein
LGVPLHKGYGLGVLGGLSLSLSHTESSGGAGWISAKIGCWLSSAKIAAGLSSEKLACWLDFGQDSSWLSSEKLAAGLSSEKLACWLNFGQDRLLGCDFRLGSEPH